MKKLLIAIIIVLIVVAGCGTTTHEPATLPVELVEITEEPIEITEEPIEVTEAPVEIAEEPTTCFQDFIIPDDLSINIPNIGEYFPENGIISVGDPTDAKTQSLRTNGGEILLTMPSQGYIATVNPGVTIQAENALEVSREIVLIPTGARVQIFINKEIVTKELLFSIILFEGIEMDPTSTLQIEGATVGTKCEKGFLILEVQGGKEVTITSETRLILKDYENISQISIGDFTMQKEMIKSFAIHPGQQISFFTEGTFTLVPFVLLQQENN